MVWSVDIDAQLYRAIGDTVHTYNQFCIISNTILYNTTKKMIKGKKIWEKDWMRWRGGGRAFKEPEGEQKMWRGWEIKEEEEENLLNVRVGRNKEKEEEGKVVRVWVG